MPTRAEIAFHEVIRGLEGQAEDLAAIRTHVTANITAGALSAAFIGGVIDDHGNFFWIAVGAFALLALVTIAVYLPVEFQYSFDGYRLIQTYVDAPAPPATEEFMLRELTVHGADDYKQNLDVLNRLWTWQAVALALFGIEIVALVLNLAVRWPS
jgi:hypothetical protein